MKDRRTSKERTKEHTARRLWELENISAKNEKEKEHDNRRLEKNGVRNEQNIITGIGRPREQENISAGDWEKKGAREQNMNRKLGRNKVARKQESLSAGDQKTKGAGEHRSSRLREEGNKRTEQEVGI